MTHEFNIHVEKVYRVEIESNKDFETVAAEVVRAYREGRLKLEDGEWLKTEFWDAETGDLVDEINCWQR